MNFENIGVWICNLKVTIREQVRQYSHIERVRITPDGRGTSLIPTLGIFTIELHSPRIEKSRKICGRYRCYPHLGNGENDVRSEI